MQNQEFLMANQSTNVRTYSVRQRMTRFLLQRLWLRAPRLTEQLALRLFFSPAAYTINDAERACLEQGRPFQIQVHDKSIHAWRWGRGPVVFMIHGWNGRGIQFHRFVAPLVSSGYTAIAIDGPAHGASSGRITSYFEFTDTLRAFLAKDRQLPIKGIIGHSFGAAAAINALSKEGQALNLVCIAPVLHLRELLLNTFEGYGIPKALYNSLIGRFEKRFGYNLKADNPHRLLGGLAAPVLIVHDEVDRIASFGESAEQVHKHAHVTLLATKGLGHRRLLTDPSVVQSALTHLGRSKDASLKILTS